MPAAPSPSPSPCPRGAPRSSPEKGRGPVAAPAPRAGSPRRTPRAGGPLSRSSWSSPRAPPRSLCKSCSLRILASESRSLVPCSARSPPGLPVRRLPRTGYRAALSFWSITPLSFSSIIPTRSSSFSSRARKVRPLAFLEEVFEVAEKALESSGDAGDEKGGLSSDLLLPLWVYRMERPLFFTSHTRKRERERPLSGGPGGVRPGARGQRRIRPSSQVLVTQGLGPFAGPPGSA